MSAPILCLVVDRSLASDPEHCVSEAVAGGVDWVQIRERALAGRPLLALAHALGAAARSAAEATGRPVRIVVNRRIDIALAIGAEAVQLGFDALAPADARALLGPRAHIGVSCHSAAQAVRAAQAGADSVQLAPIFDPLSKAASRPPLGFGPSPRRAAAASPCSPRVGSSPPTAATSCGPGLRAWPSRARFSRRRSLDGPPRRCAKPSMPPTAAGRKRPGPAIASRWAACARTARRTRLRAVARSRCAGRARRDATCSRRSPHP